MADVKIGVTNQVSMNATRDLTVPGFGTPKAAIVVTLGDPLRNVSDTTFGQFGIGFTDGTNQCCHHICIQDGVSTTNSYRRYTTDSLAMRVASNTGGILSEVGFSSWITDGIRLVPSASSSGLHYWAILFGGADLSAYVKTQALSTQDTKVTVTGAGFTPDLAFLICTGLHSGSKDSVISRAIKAFGCAHDNGASIDQRSIGWRDEDALGTSQITNSLITNGCVGQLGTGVSSASWDWYGDITAFNSDGCDIYARGGSSGSDEVGILFLNIGTKLGKLSTVTTPTSTGDDDAMSSLSFSPDGCVVGFSSVSSVDTVHAASDETDCIGLGASMGISEKCSAIASDDNVGTSDTALKTSEKLINYIDHAGNDTMEAELVNFTSDAIALNYTNTLSSNRYAWMFAFGESSEDLSFQHFFNRQNNTPIIGM
jgi:hypothetical protein